VPEAQSQKASSTGTKIQKMIKIKIMDLMVVNSEKDNPPAQYALFGTPDALRDLAGRLIQAADEGPNAGGVILLITDCSSRESLFAGFNVGCISEEMFHEASVSRFKRS
jgi:hypothetical protein